MFPLMMMGGAMSGLMSGIGGMLGSQAQNQGISEAKEFMRKGYDEGKSALNTGYTDATGRVKVARQDLTDQYGVARGDINPMVQAGGQARTRMMDGMGLNGADAQKAYSEGIYSNPLFTKQLDLAGNQMSGSFDARSNAGGNMYSGAAALAKNRALGELSTNMATQFENNQFGRLAGLNQQGVQGSLANAQLAQNHGGNLAQNGYFQSGLDMTHGSDLANLGIGYANAMGGLSMAKGKSDAGGISSLFGGIGSMFGGGGGGGAGGLGSIFGGLGK